VPTRLAPGIREKRPGYFEVRVYAGVEPLTGRARYVSRTVRGSVKDANALRASLLAEADRLGPETRQTVAELFSRVIEHLEALGREPTTILSYRQIATVSAARLGRTPLSKLRADHLDTFYEELLRAGKSPARVRRYHAFIRRSLAQARRWDWVRENVADRASPPTEPRRRFEVQSARSVVALIQAAETSRMPELAVAFRLLASLGGRRGEVCGLQWRDFDFSCRSCTIRRAVKHVPGRTFVGDVKSHQERTVLLDEGTVHVLAAHRRSQEELSRMCGVVLRDNAFVLSDSADGAEPWQPNRLTQALRRLRDGTGYTGRLHDLRHWHASQLLESGESAVVVAARLGHSDPATTHRWYAHMMPAADQRASAAIERALTRLASAT
jgi:integrase